MQLRSATGLRGARPTIYDLLNGETCSHSPTTATTALDASNNEPRHSAPKRKEAKERRRIRRRKRTHYVMAKTGKRGNSSRSSYFSSFSRLGCRFLSIYKQEPAALPLFSKPTIKIRSSKASN